MVKLKGPALALGAAGTLGGVLVHSNWRGRSYAKKLTIPAQPRPNKQVSTRALFAFLTERWSTLNALHRGSYRAVPGYTDVEPYHQYIGENTRTWQRAQPPSKVYPATRTGIQASFDAWNATAQGRRTEHAIRCDVLNASWGIIMMRHSAVINVDHFDYAITVWPITSTGWHRFWDGPLTPATYKYRFKRFAVDGALGGWSSTRTVVIS